MKNKKNTKNSHWKTPTVFFLLTVFFIVTQILGIYIASVLIGLDINTQLFSENVNDISNGVYLFFLILFMTGIILIILKLKKKSNFLWIIEGISVFATGIIFFGAFFPNDDLIALILTLILMTIRYLNKENLWIKNIVSVIAISAAGALIGISIGVIPVLLFILILSVYDLIAVFKTKHMVTLGSAVIKKNFAFTVSIPTKKHKFELGNGDLIIPLVVATSIMANGFFLNNYFVAALSLIASFVGLSLTIYILTTKKIPLPALPLQVLFIIIIIGLSLFLGL